MGNVNPFGVKHNLFANIETIKSTVLALEGGWFWHSGLWVCCSMALLISALTVRNGTPMFKSSVLMLGTESEEELLLAFSPCMTVD